MIIGVVTTKKYSKRFPDKNIYELNGMPLFWHSVQPLLDSNSVDKVYVATDSPYIKSYCQDRNVPVIWRNINATIPEDKLITIVRFAYYSIEEKCDIFVTIMPNCPGHSGEDVDRAINLLREKNLREVRSFNVNGEENGLIVYSSDLMEINNDVSYYMGCIIDNAKDIHYKEDLDE